MSVPDECHTYTTDVNELYTHVYNTYTDVIVIEQIVTEHKRAPG